MREDSSVARRTRAVAFAFGLFRSGAPAGSAIGLCVLLIGLSLFNGCSPRPSLEEGVRRVTRPMMGTLVEIVWRTRGGEHEAEAVRTALNRMDALAARMSLYDPSSELVKLNAAAGKAPVEVSDELLEVIERSLTVSGMTGGAFDVTVGPVEAAWGDIQREGGGRVPGDQAVRDALDRVGYEHVRIDRKAKTVFLEKEGMRIDLGGIAKGYIVDQGMAWVDRGGIKDALVNAGGDIRASGGPESPPWRIGLQDPLEKGGLLGFFSLREGAIVTSGTYERYFQAKEGRFAHIVDPRTGRPVRGLLGVTVVAEESSLADALATAAMVGGREGGIDLLNRFPGVRGVLVDEEGTVWVEQGLKEVLELDSLPARYTVRFYGGPASLRMGMPQGFGWVSPVNRRWAWIVQGRNPSLSQKRTASGLLT
jgi:thiamine biosynthesis lipoprotein